MQVFSYIVVVITLLFAVASGQQTVKCRNTYYSCGEHKCCCNANKAICKDFHKRLNYIPKLPAGITELYFLSNYLPVVTADTFQNVEPANISVLKLTYNEIASISIDAFKQFTNLKTLTLNGNSRLNMTQLSLSFQSINKQTLEKLSLQSMNISKLPDYFFEYLAGSRLHEIHLNENNFTQLRIKVFEPLDNLHKLSFTKNIIRDVNPGDGHNSLRSIDLSGNEITRRPPSFCPGSQQLKPFPNLKYLSLKGNFISELTCDKWNCLDGLVQLDLSQNVVRKITKNTFSCLQNLTDLRLSDMRGSIDKIERYAFNNSALQNLELRGNSIVFKPLKFLLIFTGCTNLRSLDLSHNNLRHLKNRHIKLFFSPLKQLKELKLISAKIYHLPSDFLRQFPDISDVYLDGNDIRVLGEAFIPVHKLRRLSVQSNGIRVVEENAVSKRLFDSIQQLNIAMNPFDCTCEMLWFRNIIDANGNISNISLVNWPRTYFCRSPSARKNMLFVEFHPSWVTCRIIVLKAMISVSTILFTIVLLLIISYKYRWYLAYHIYKFKLKTRCICPEQQPLLANNVRHNDGYVIYHEEDRHFVHNDLIAITESKMQYKMHIMGRDFEPGISKLENMVNSIFNSDHAVAVISSNSMTDRWFVFQLDVALDRQVDLGRPFLLLIILEDIDFAQLSKYWCVMLTRQLSAHWCSLADDVRRHVFEQKLTHHLGANMITENGRSTNQ